jgi:hypothetical protein
MKKELLNKINRLGKEYYEHSSQSGNQLDMLVFLSLDYLQNHPRDIDMWLILSILETNPPLEDPYAITKYVNKILTYEPSHVPALLIMAWAHHVFFGEIGTDAYLKLCFAHSDNTELMSMIELAKSYYFDCLIDRKKSQGLDWQEEFQEKKKSLERSVSYFQKNVRNLSELAQVYQIEGKSDEVERLLFIIEENGDRVRLMRELRQCNAASIEHVYEYFR